MKKWRSAVLFFQSCCLSVMFIGNRPFPQSQPFDLSTMYYQTDGMHDNFSLIPHLTECNLPAISLQPMKCGSSIITERAS